MFADSSLGVSLIEGWFHCKSRGPHRGDCQASVLWSDSSGKRAASSGLRAFAGRTEEQVASSTQELGVGVGVNTSGIVAGDHGILGLSQGGEGVVATFCLDSTLAAVCRPLRNSCLSVPRVYAKLDQPELSRPVKAGRRPSHSVL